MSCILLVDDDESFLKATKQILEILGHEVMTAFNGKVASEFVLQIENIDLVISDIRMPEMDGIELTKFIMANRPMPVILMTGFSDVIETKEAFAVGAKEFIPKPFTKSDIKEAIDRSLKTNQDALSENETEFCKLALDDFISGREIKFNIFVKLSHKKFIKIAHRGEDLSINKIKSYRQKGIFHLFLRKEDFSAYVGLSIKLVKSIKKNTLIDKGKRINLLKHTGEILMEQICHDGLDEETYQDSATFIETTVEILTENVDLFKLLQSLNGHTDFLYAHSVGVSLYSVLMAKVLEWNLPSNRFKVAMGGLFHDIGLKEFDASLLAKPRVTWSLEDVKKFEDHPTRGVLICSEIDVIPEEVLRIIQEHHEDCTMRGYPLRLKRSAIHPMAKLVSVANEFCERVIKGPNHKLMSPSEALVHMVNFCDKKLDRQFFEALMKLFKFSPIKMRDQNLIQE